MGLKDPSIFIPLATEDLLFLIQRVLFGISCFLHVPAISCLLWQTPPHQNMIKPYLVTCQVRRMLLLICSRFLVQICVVVCDMYFSVFFEPILIGDIFGGYCRGIFCSAVGTARAMAAYIILDAILVLVILACILERHQAMMPSGNFFKLQRRTKIAIFVVVFLVCGTPTTVFTTYPFSVLESDKLINESIFDIAWIRERSPYVILPDNIFMHTIIWLAATAMHRKLIISIALIVGNAPFYHMFYVLNQEVHRSKRTKSLIQLSLKRLYAQISVPIFLLGIPLNIFFLQAGARCFPFMFATVAPFTICFHPIFHNLILLLVIPTYRRAIVDSVRVWKWGSK
ncbi:hypothetical protein PRIPAC_93754, partial [Pristionchus pacificus]|uniref:G protein-coupled receptor n=1 Tax=Pristionchus pacificus TaxID=54126 RepID=A0A2A6BQ44_PRIPA